MASPIKFCHCRQCKYCLRHHKHAQVQMKRVARHFRRLQKAMIRDGRFEEIPDKVSAGYPG